MLRWLFIVLLLIPFALVRGQEATEEATNEVAWIRFSHASADTANIDLYVDGELTAENLAFLEVTAYFSLEAGTHEVAVVPTGETIDAALQKRSGPLAAGHTYIVGASGLQESGTFLLFVLDETAMMQTAIEGAAEMGDPDVLAGFIILHAIENGPALSIVFQTGETVASNLQYGGYYASPVVPGNYPIVIMTADGSEVVFNELNPLQFGGGLLYFVIMTGTPEEPQLVLSMTGTKTIDEILKSSDTISTFASGLDEAGLMERLATEGPFTVFAPSNGALEEAGEANVEYHIVPGLYHLSDIQEQETLTTLSGDDLIVGNSASDNSQISILLNDIPLEFSGVLAINGIVYLVNSALTPAK